MTNHQSTLEVLYHMKARIFVLLTKDSEAIKILKKWTRIEEDPDDQFSVFAYYLIGFLYDKNGNPKDALKWLKRVFIEKSDYELSIGWGEVRVTYFSLYEIARIKFLQKEYQLSELILNEFCSTFTNHEDVLSGTFLKDSSIFPINLAHLLTLFQITTTTSMQNGLQ